MRVLAAYRAESFVGFEAAEDHQHMAELGLLPGEDAAGLLAWVDPIEDERVRPEGEHEKGIAVYRHPEILLTEDPELWLVVDAWRCSTARELSLGDYATISNWEVEAWLTLRAAHAREEIRERKRFIEEQQGVAT